MPDQLRKIFVGYPFALGYVPQVVERAANGHAIVVVASDVLRGKPLLHKIEDLMKEADLCLFDLTLHNANVATEFGLAHGRNYKYAILYCTDEHLNPEPERESSVYSDVKGWDSLLYTDEADLEIQLRRFLPELLSAPLPHAPAPMHIPKSPEARPAVKPRLNAAVKIITPGFIAVGSGPLTKLGNYRIGFELWNSGKGIANKVRVAVTGMNTVQRFQALDVGAKYAAKFAWDLEAQPAYRTQPQFPALIVEYEDDQGAKYEQRGLLNVKRLSDGTHHYEGDGLGPPQQIKEYTILWN
mgnify:CR=1 FL=1